MSKAGAVKSPEATRRRLLDAALLEFYANGARRTLNDPGKARFHDKERALLQVIEAELAKHKGGGGGEEEPPPHGDDAPAHGRQA